jgi:hypothetical protein
MSQEERARPGRLGTESTPRSRGAAATRARQRAPASSGPQPTHRRQGRSWRDQPGRPRSERRRPDVGTLPAGRPRRRTREELRTVGAKGKWTRPWGRSARWTRFGWVAQEKALQDLKAAAARPAFANLRSRRRRASRRTMPIARHRLRAAASPAGANPGSAAPRRIRSLRRRPFQSWLAIARPPVAAVSAWGNPESAPRRTRPPRCHPSELWSPTT